MYSYSQIGVDLDFVVCGHKGRWKGEGESYGRGEIEESQIMGPADGEGWYFLRGHEKTIEYGIINNWRP